MDAQLPGRHSSLADSRARPIQLRRWLRAASATRRTSRASPLKCELSTLNGQLGPRRTPRGRFFNERKLRLGRAVVVSD